MCLAKQGGDPLFLCFLCFLTFSYLQLLLTVCDSQNLTCEGNPDFIDFFGQSKLVNWWINPIFWQLNQHSVTFRSTSWKSCYWFSDALHQASTLNLKVCHVGKKNGNYITSIFKGIALNMTKILPWYAQDMLKLCQRYT